MRRSEAHARPNAERPTTPRSVALTVSSHHGRYIQTNTLRECVTAP
jgi:hypothetical protein